MLLPVGPSGAHLSSQLLGMLRLKQEDSKPKGLPEPHNLQPPSPSSFHPDVPRPLLPSLTIASQYLPLRLSPVSFFYLIKFQLHLQFSCTAPNPGETLRLIVPAQYKLLITFWTHCIQSLLLSRSFAFSVQVLPARALGNLFSFYHLLLFDPPPRPSPQKI